MPPEYANIKLTDAQKDTMRRWIQQGAKYESHWSYQPILRPAVPATPKPANPIDAFIQARLAKEGLKPSPEADKRTLIRRVSLDLTGLLPTPEQVAAFEADKSPDAYDKLVDRLLAYARLRRTAGRSLARRRSLRRFRRLSQRRFAPRLALSRLRPESLPR